MPVELSNRQRKTKVQTKLLKARASEILDHLGHGEDELSVVLVSDGAMRRLNREYRGKDAPTDVLSFSMAEGEFGDINPGGVLGDVIISVETAERQAAARDGELGGAGYDLELELAFLLVHGVLHLLGHDHEDEGEAREMEAQERVLFSAWSPLNPRPHHVV